MLWLIPVDTHAKSIDRWPPPGQPTLYKSEHGEPADIHRLPGAGIACTDGRLRRFEKALLPVSVISDPGNGTQKFLLLRAGPTGRERCDESRRHARD
jgi:hypothetical protein